MNLKDILITGFNTFFRWRKASLIEALTQLRERYLESQAKVKQLEQENRQLKEQIEQGKIKATNKEVNKPSSKQAEWEKGSSNGEDESKKKGKRRKRKPRKGAGNRAKNKEPNQTATATVEECDICGKDLSNQAALESSNERIIEDIPEPPEETVVTLVTQEKKYCSDCKEVITAKSELALPKLRKKSFS